MKSGRVISVVGALAVSCASLASANSISSSDCADCPPMISIPPLPWNGKRIRVARHELTWKEYRVAVREARCVAPALNIGERSNDSDSLLDSDHPVTNVSIDGIGCYIRWINAKTGHQYRLPNNQEWEFFARAGTVTAYPWGQHIGFGNAIVSGYYDPTKLQRPGNPRAVYDPRPAVASGLSVPVESLLPNPWGIYDAIGSVAEAVNEFKDGPASCVAKFGRERCELIRVRGGGAMPPANPDGLLTKGEFKFAHMPDSGLGYRLVVE